MTNFEQSALMLIYTEDYKKSFPKERKSGTREKLARLLYATADRLSRRPVTA